jgi:hypothetical protein
LARALIDVAFRVCREPTKVSPQVKRLSSIRNQS